MRFAFILLFAFPFRMVGQIEISAYEKKVSTLIQDLDKISAPEARSSCGKVEVKKIEQFMSGGCASTLAVVFHYTDRCGNTAMADLYVKVLDNTAPTFISKPGDIVVSGALPAIGEVLVTDDSGFESKIELEETVSANQALRKWTATDPCGNRSTYVQVITMYAN